MKFFFVNLYKIWYSLINSNINLDKPIYLARLSGSTGPFLFLFFLVYSFMFLYEMISGSELHNLGKFERMFVYFISITILEALIFDVYKLENLDYNNKEFLPSRKTQIKTWTIFIISFVVFVAISITYFSYKDSLRNE